MFNIAVFVKIYNMGKIYNFNTAVVVIEVAVSSILQICEVWIAFGHSNKIRYIPCHRIANKLGTDASCGLLFFHTVSGCQHCVGLERKQLGLFGAVCLP